MGTVRVPVGTVPNSMQRTALRAAADDARSLRMKVSLTSSTITNLHQHQGLEFHRRRRETERLDAITGYQNPA